MAKKKPTGKRKIRRRCAVCEKLTYNRVACSKLCAARWAQSKSPLSQKGSDRPSRMSLEARFFAFLAKEPPPLPLPEDYDFGDDCWPWYGAIDSHGYATFWLGKEGRAAGRTAKRIFASKFSWEYFNGPVPDKHIVVINCENKTCSNPNHLKCGTHAELLAPIQRVLRKSVRYGDQHGSSILTDADVIELRKLSSEKRWPEIRALAELRGVTYPHALSVGRSTGRKRKGKNLVVNYQ